MMKILMCKADYYDIAYEINPWMNIAIRPDDSLAKKQWEALYQLYLQLGVEVELIEQRKELPDMVFTANGGIVLKNLFISGNYRYRERKGEETLFQQWFKARGYEVKQLSDFQGGEGDALFYGDTLYMGYGFRSEKRVHEEIGRLLNVNVVSLRLVNPYFYDFDTAFCPLGERGVLYYLPAYDEESQERIRAIPGGIPLTDEQAQNFVANSTYINGKLLVGFCDDDLSEKLKKLDIEPIQLDMSEYKKAGGGIKCLTLYLER